VYSPVALSKAAMRSLSIVFDKAFGGRQGLQHFLGGEGPGDAVGADRPAAAAAGVLDDLQAVGRAGHLRRFNHAIAPAGQLEQQRIAHPLRIQQGQAQVRCVGQVAGPDVVPLLAGLEAVAGDGVVAVVVAVADFLDRVQAHLVGGQCEQGVEGQVAAADLGQGGILFISSVLRTGVAQLHGGRVRIAAQRRLWVPHREAGRLLLAVPGRKAQACRRACARVRIGGRPGRWGLDAAHAQHRF
jgi:hypothetical protein